MKGATASLMQTQPQIRFIFDPELIPFKPYRALGMFNQVVRRGLRKGEVTN